MKAEAPPAPEQILVYCADDYPIAGTWFAPGGEPQAVVVIASALGVARRLYTAFCQYLASQGVAAVCFDYRGIGDSAPPQGQEEAIDFESWGRLDIDAVIRAAVSRHPGVPTYLIGHSCGGQLFPLAPSSKQLAGAVLVGATLPHRSRYPWPRKLKLWWLWRVLIPLFARGEPQALPKLKVLAHLGAPNAVLRQWARWCRKREYVFHRSFGLQTAGYASLEIPMLVLGFSDDLQAPPSAIDALAERFDSATIDRRQVSVRRLGLNIGSVGHTGFFRSKMRDALWFMVVDWMQRHRH